MSWQLRAATIALRAYAAVRRGAGTAQAMQAAIERSRAKPPKIPPPAKAVRGLAVSATSVDGVTVYELQPPTNPLGRHVLYLHGGSYTFEISPFHWRFLGEISRSAPAQTTVPIYTLAPESSAEATVAAMTDLLERVIDERGSQNVTLMGDSAGGGMSLAVAQQLRDRGKQPARIVLISPWLDVTMSAPDAKAIERHDIMLRVDALRHCGKLYAGDLDGKDPRVSPLFGEMKGLAPIDLFIGSYDVFYADLPSMQAAAEAGGADLTVHEAPKMPHVYPILPIPEGAAARATIVELVRDTPRPTQMA